MKRTRIAVVLNIIGMSISLMVFLVLFAQVWFDFRYNRNIKDYKNIYRFEQIYYPDAFGYNYNPIITKDQLNRFKTCSPDIAAACAYAEADTDFGFKIGFNDNGEIKKYDIPWTYTDSDFTKVFEIEFISGSAEDYNRYNAALISEKNAKTIFGDRNPIGETLVLEMFEYEFQIVGVYKDMPENCFILNGLLINDGNTEETIAGSQSGFFRLRDGASPEDVLSSFTDCPEGARLTPLSETHFLEDTAPGRKPYARKTQTIVLLSISLLFLLISIFNYINFAIASIPFRINEINIEKVYGAARGRLVFNQLKNNVAICLISFALAMGLMEIVAGSQFAEFSSCSLAVKDNLYAILICLGVAVVSAVSGGLVTSLYSTSFDPGTVLKGDFAISGKGRTFRRTSMILQFVLSCVFLICSIVISRQTDYMVNHNNGFYSKNVLHMQTILYSRWYDYFDELLKNPEIIEITCGDSPMQESHLGRNKMLSKDGENVWYSIRHAYHNFFDFFDFELIEGRFPNEGEDGKIIVTESFSNIFPDYTIGSKLSWPSEGEIIGVVKDFNARPLMHEMEPVAYFVGSQITLADMFLKVESNDMEETIQMLKDTMGGLYRFNDATLAWDAAFLDEEIEMMYRKEIGQARLITASSLLCLIVALIGVLGIVYFETSVMRKEIAIRKINGATRWVIIRSVIGRYSIISSIGFLIAVPVSILIMNWWLSGFAYHIGMSVWMFALSYFLITALTAAVVVIRGYAAASENPVNVLKKE